MEAVDQVAINPAWSADLEEGNEKNVKLDDLKFIFSQAEKRMDDGIKNFDATTTKSVNFITLCTALLTAMAAYFFSGFDPKGVFSPKLFTVISCCFYTGFVLYRFVGIILPKEYQPIGSFPQDLFAEKYFKEPGSWYKAKDIPASTLALYLNELESYQVRIYQNTTANEERLKVFNQAAKYICGMPLFGLFVYFVVLGVMALC